MPQPTYVYVVKANLYQLLMFFFSHMYVSVTVLNLHFLFVEGDDMNEVRFTTNYVRTYVPLRIYCCV